MCPRFIQKFINTRIINDPPLWHYDHAVDHRLNVYAGLAGIYIIRNEQERF